MPNKLMTKMIVFSHPCVKLVFGWRSSSTVREVRTQDCVRHSAATDDELVSGLLTSRRVNRCVR